MLFICTIVLERIGPSLCKVYNYKFESNGKDIVSGSVQSFGNSSLTTRTLCTRTSTLHNVISVNHGKY